MTKNKATLQKMFDLLQHLVESDCELHERVADIDQKVTYLIERKRPATGKRLDSKLSDFRN